MKAIQKFGCLRFFSTLSCLVFLVGCSGGSPSVPPPPPSGNLVPSIASVSPSSATVGAQAQTLTINGSNLLSNSTVTYNGQPHAPTFMSSTQLSISLSASDQATAGNFAIIVSNPAPGGGQSNSANFTMNNPQPSLSSLSPSALASGSPDTTITIAGANFVAKSTVSLNGTALATGLISPTQLNAVVPSGSLASSGTSQVTVTSPSPGGGTAGPINLTVVAVSSFVIMATPGGGPATGPWQIAVGAADPQGRPVANLPVSLKATAGSTSLSQGFTDSSGTLTASVSPPVPYSGEAVAVSATTGSQTAAVNIAFVSSSSSSSKVQSEQNQARTSQTPSSTTTTLSAPLMVGSSGSPGSNNPLGLSNSCYTNVALSTIPSALCQANFSENGISLNVLDVANSVCDKLSQAQGGASCAGLTAEIGICLLAGPGVAACLGTLEFVTGFSTDCIKFVVQVIATRLGLKVNATTFTLIDLVTFIADPTINFRALVGMTCNVISVADFGIGTGVTGTRVTVVPARPVAALGDTVRFIATVTGSPGNDTTVTWTVNDFPANVITIFGGVDDSGVYTAPLTLPSTLLASPVANLVTVRATSKQDPTASAPATVTLVTTTGGASGSTAIIPGLVNGRLVDKAYVPLPGAGAVSVVNVDAGLAENPVVTHIPMPPFYGPNATAADPTTQQVVVISSTSPDVQIIDASKDQLITTLTSPVFQTAPFSGGNCMICGVAVDPTRSSVILDTAQGYLLLNLVTRQFSSFIPGTVAGENFGYNPNTRIVLNPTYNQSVPPGLQAVNLGENPVSVSTYLTALNSRPDSAAVDLQTNIAVVPDEDTGNQFLINMGNASFSSGTFSAPNTVFNITFPDCVNFIASNEWTMLSIESSTHFLFLGTEFGDCAAVEQLPTSSVSGAPPPPTTFNWGHMPAAPDGGVWDNGADPHGIAVFTSVVNGKPYGFLIRNDQAWVARIDLQGVASAPPLSGGVRGQVALTPFVVFLKTQ